MASIKRIIIEDGVVLEKIFKEATDEFKSSDGKIISAQPDRYILKCISGEEFTKQNGFTSSSVLDYKVDKAVFDKTVAYSPVVVRYELSNFGLRAVSAELKEK